MNLTHIFADRREIFQCSNKSRESERRFIMLTVILQKEYRILPRAREKFSYVRRKCGSASELEAVMLWLCQAEWEILIARSRGREKSSVRFAMFVHLSARITAASTRRISMKFDIWNSHEKVCREIANFVKNRSKISAALHENISSFIFFRWRYIAMKALSWI